MSDIGEANQERIGAPLANARLAFIGCGVMAESIIAGLLREGIVDAEQIVGSHPRSARREELQAKYAIRMFESNRDAALASHPVDSAVSVAAAPVASLVILAVKPQRLESVLKELEGAIH